MKKEHKENRFQNKSALIPEYLLKYYYSLWEIHASFSRICVSYLKQHITGKSFCSSFFRKRKRKLYFLFGKPLWKRIIERQGQDINKKMSSIKATQNFFHTIINIHLS